MDQSIRRRIAADDLTYDEAESLDWDLAEDSRKEDILDEEVAAPEAVLVQRVLVSPPNWVRRVLSQSQHHDSGTNTRKADVADGRGNDGFNS